MLDYLLKQAGRTKIIMIRLTVNETTKVMTMISLSRDDEIPRGNDIERLKSTIRQTTLPHTENGILGVEHGMVVQ